MDRDACLAVLKNAVAGGDESQMKAVLDEIERRAAFHSTHGTLGNLEDSIFKAAADVAKDIRIEALVRQRQAAINVIRREGLHERLAKFKNPVEGLKALLVGVQRAQEGARQSIDGAHLSLSRQYQAGMLNDLEKAGLFTVFRSKSLDYQIAKELWEIRPDGSPGISGSKEAQQIAQIMHKWQLAQMERQNRAGAYIKELKGYIVRQSHDQRKLTAAGFEKWFGFVVNKVDLERTVGDADPREVLEGIFWDLVKGREANVPEEQLIRAGRGPDVAAKASAHREIHFKSAEAWMDYNQAFGNKGLAESSFAAMDNAARNIALMETLGPEPEAMFKTVIQDLIDKSKDVKTISHLKGETKQGQMLQAYFKEVSGDTSHLANNGLSRFFRGWRVMNSLSKLGLVVISSITDVATKAAEFHYEGMGLLQGYAQSLTDLFSTRSKGEIRQLANLLGAGFEGMMSDVHGRFTSSDDLPGGMTKTMNLFFKWNGLNWWTDTQKRGFVLMLSHHLAGLEKVPFDRLPPELKNVLPMYGLGDNKWNVLRSLAQDGPDGRRYLVPESVENLSKDQVLQAYGLKKATERDVRRMKDELQTSLRSYLIDRSDYAILTPGAAERAYANLGTQSGTILGEAVRMLMQFKQFPLTGVSKGFGRGIYGKGAETLWEAIRKGKGDFVGMAHLMVGLTVLGYAAMSLKDIVKGRTPRDPTDPKTWAAAFAQGGGAGIYGDFIFGEFNRFGTSALASLTGPAAGQIESVAELWARVRDGDDAAAKAFKFAINNTPFINLAYTRPVMDYMFLYAVQEALNPGYIRRMEKRMKKDNNQTFLFPPSKYAVGVR